MSSKPKALVVHSGGLDSTVLLYEMMRDFHVIGLVGVDYNQRHSKELYHAQLIADRLNLPRHEIQISLRLESSSQTSHAVPVPEGHYTAENMKTTVVPNRNMILLALAAAKAVDLGAEIIGFGAHSGDHAIYPDCRPEFITVLGDAISIATENKVRIFAPFDTVTKAQIVARGVELEVPFEMTWTCYKGNKLACGRCGTCVERLEAFDIANATDPLQYGDREFYKQAIKVQ